MPRFFQRSPESLLVPLMLCFFSLAGSFAGAQEVTENQSALKVSKPVVYQNLTVYVLSSDNSDDREFITLNEGLESGKVTVTELKSETVNTLQIQNNSELPLFLQEGDRVTGGKQARTIYCSMVVEANSRPQNIPTFCIEQSRWSTGALGKSFKCNANTCYASNAVRGAAKIAKDQSFVWDEVAKSKAALQQTIGTSNSNSSLNEAIDSKKVIESTSRFKTVLGNLIAQNSRAVGFAFAVNGEIKEINVFPGHKLASKVYSRMLETYALDAIANKASTVAASPTAEDVSQLMKTKTEQVKREEQVDESNRLVIRTANKEATGPQTYRCETTFNGKLVHKQWLRAEIAQSTSQGRLNLSNLPADNAQQVQQIEPAPRHNRKN